MGLMDTIKGWFSKGKDMAGDVAEKAEGAWDKTKDVAGDMVEKAKDVAEDVKDKFDGDDDEGAAAE